MSYKLLGFVLSYLLFSIISYALSSQPSDKAFGMIPELHMPTFADLRWVAATGVCSININDLYAGKSVGAVIPLEGSVFAVHQYLFGPLIFWN
jgi:hypothetical protein